MCEREEEQIKTEIIFEHVLARQYYAKAGTSHDKLAPKWRLATDDTRMRRECEYAVCREALVERWNINGERNERAYSGCEYRGMYIRWFGLNVLQKTNQIKGLTPRKATSSQKLTGESTGKEE